GWIPTNSIGMVHGQSASGKTTIMLDLLLSASSGQAGWCGNRIPNPINVVYLCGEGLIGVKRRLRAWKARAGVESLGHFAVYPLPLDLDTPAGVHEIRSQVDILGWKPDIIVIDTVNRYMSGDENSAQDTRTLLNCVDSLRSTYSCSGLYVHHTGNNEDAQKRARGSSAWRGALDFEISVTKMEDGTREVEQVKMKDSELMPKLYGVIEGEPIPGLFDDDGELVTGAVFSTTDAPIQMSAAEKNLMDSVDMILKLYSGLPHKDRHISRDEFANFLVSEGKYKSMRTAKNNLSDDREDRIIGKLIKAEILSKEGDGWYIKDTPHTHMVLGFIDQGKQ
ncbi:MAG: AAA family ATPase, partial [Spirochaetales bacterium]|nr:AAA family ATPase [Spirochaetales bacterium]